MQLSVAVERFRVGTPLHGNEEASFTEFEILANT